MTRWQQRWRSSWWQTAAAVEVAGHSREKLNWRQQQAWRRWRVGCRGATGNILQRGGEIRSWGRAEVRRMSARGETPDARFGITVGGVRSSALAE